MLTEKKDSEKIILISYLIIIGFAIIMIRLWQLQILQGSELRQISESNRLRIIGVPAPRGIIFDRNNLPLVKNTTYFSASVIPKEFESKNIPSLSKLLDLPEDELSAKIAKRSQNPFAPLKLKEGLSFDEVSFIEARRSDYPGLIIDVELSRHYIYGSAGSHLIGYLGKLTPAQSKDPEFRDVPPDAFIGQWGVERMFDKSLRGTAGQRVIEVDALGHEIRLLQENNPIKGKDLTLSLDIALQYEAEKAFDGKTGALVALNPNTGAVLGLVSSPSFDPNKFVKGISYDEWQSLTEDAKIPLLNRAVQSQYPPGSTFKIITAIAGLEEGVINNETKVSCTGGINVGKWRFGCWKKTGHNIVSVHKAIVESCDVYFYEVGNRLGIDKINSYALMLGLGEETGLAVGREKKGLIPSSKWKMDTKKEPWYLGETFISAIGQGYVSTTPVQMAVMMSAVANNGTVYKPSILKGSTPEIVKKANIRPETLEIVKDGLKGVVNEPGGTGHASRSNTILIGGKTGTAQVVGIRKDSKDLAEKHRDHAWFVAYAPVAFCICRARGAWRLCSSSNCKKSNRSLYAF